MRCRGLAGSGFALLLTAGVPAAGEQYNVVANAGNAGDSHNGDNSDPDAFATWSVTDGGTEIYTASANLAGGSFGAAASRSGAPIGTAFTRAAVSIQETLTITEVPSGPIQIRAVFGAMVNAVASGTGFANAGASLRLQAFSAGQCSTSIAVNGAGQFSDLSTCNVPDSTSGADGMVLTLTPEQLADINYEIYLDIDADAKFETPGANFEGIATVSGGGDALLAARRSGRGSEPIPGVVYLEIDPPTGHSFEGENTDFPIPAPEPGAPLLAAVGAAVLATVRRRRPA